MAKSKKVVTTEHSEWDEKAKAWKPTHKTVEETEHDEDDGPLGNLWNNPRPNPWSPNQYRPMWEDPVQPVPMPAWPGQFPVITCDTPSADAGLGQRVGSLTWIQQRL